MIRAILACDDEWGIGKNGDLPWPHNPADLRWFKQCTDGDVVVMGRNTWDSLPVKPLPKRKNLVVSQTAQPQPNVEVVKPDIFKSRLHILAEEMPVWIIGGAHLIETSLDIIDEIWLSQIEGTYDCDTFLPRTAIELTFDLVSSRRDGDVYIDKWRKI